MAEQPPEEHDSSIAALFARLIDDAERFVRAEVRLYRAQFLSRVGEARSAIILVVLALLLAQSAMIATVLVNSFGTRWFNTWKLSRSISRSSAR